MWRRIAIGVCGCIGVFMGGTAGYFALIHSHKLESIVLFTVASGTFYKGVQLLDLAMNPEGVDDDDFVVPPRVLPQIGNGIIPNQIPVEDVEEVFEAVEDENDEEVEVMPIAEPQIGNGVRHLALQAEN